MPKHPAIPIPSSQSDHILPSRMGHALYLAMHEILGREGVVKVFEQADLQETVNAPTFLDGEWKLSFEQISRVQAGIEGAFGTRAGRGLAMRIGRAAFTHGVREFGAELGLSDSNFRLLPLQAKLKTGTEALAALFNAQAGQQIRLEMDEKSITWHIERCPICRERQAESPCCQLAVGLLQEALFWVSGGKYFTVKEMKCAACGDGECMLLIDRSPMA